MESSIPTYAYFFLLNALLVVILGVLVIFRRSAIGLAASQALYPSSLGIWNSFSFLMISIFIWTGGRFFEAVVVGIPQKVFWAKVEYVGIASIGALWLLFAVQFSQNFQWTRFRSFSLIWVIPILTLLLAWTNERHGLIWTQIYPSPTGDSSILVYDHGAWFWVHVAYTYLTMLVGMILLMVTALRKPGIKRLQVWSLLLSASLPLLGNVIYLLGLSPVRGLDLTPFGFTLAIGVYSVSLFGFRLFDLMPVARDLLVENMKDSVLVVDEQDRLVDINPAAMRLLGLTGFPSIGKKLIDLFPQWKQWIDNIQGVSDTSIEINSLDGKSVFELRVSALMDGSQRIGRLILLRDISSLKRIEIAEHQQRLLAEALKDCGAALNSTLNFEEVLDRILENVERVVPYDLAVILMLDEQDVARPARVRCVVSPEIEAQAREVILPLSQTSNLQTMVTTGEACLIPNVKEYPGWVLIKGLERLHTFAGAPVIDQGKVAGFITVQSAKPGLYTAEHADRLRLFAAQAGSAIHNARLFADTSQRTRQLEALHRISLSITSGLERQQILETLLEQCRKVLPIDTFYAGVLDDSGQKLEFPIFFDQGQLHYMPARNMQQEPGLSGYVINNRRTLNIPDMLIPEGLPPVKVFHLGGIPTRSYVGVPLTLGERVLGIVSIQSLSPNAYTLDQVNLLETIAAQTAVALENARLYTEVSQRASQLEGLHDVGLAITSGLQMDQVLQNLLEQTKKILPVDAFYVCVYDENTGEIEFPLFYDMGEVRHVEKRNIHSSPGLTGSVIQAQKTLWIKDLRALHPGIPKPIDPLGGIPARDYVGVPVILSERVLGVISMQSYLANVYTPEQVHLFETIATQAAVALENARLYAQVQHLTLVDELTGAYNYRGLLELGGREVERACRFDHPLSALFMDVDDFREFNNRYSHAAGNLVLKAVVEASRKIIRATDLLVRYGGDEFIILMPETTIKQALQGADRLRREVAEIRLETEWGELQVTLSLGVAELTAEMENLSALIESANQAERQAKKHGRNRMATPSDL